MSTTAGTDAQGQAPDVTGQQAGQAPTAQQNDPNAPQGTQDGDTGQAPNQAAPQGPDLSTITDPELRAWVEAQAREAREARQEAARYRTERNTLNESLTAAQRANETTEQRAQREQEEREQEFATLRAENKALKVGGAWTDAATTARAIDPAALLTLVGGIDKIDLDESGKPTNLDALITEARTKYPYLFSRTSADAGAGGGQAPANTGGTGMNDFIRGGRARASTR